MVAMKRKLIMAAVIAGIGVLAIVIYKKSSTVQEWLAKIGV